MVVERETGTTGDTPLVFTYTWDREGDRRLPLPKKRQLTVSPRLAGAFARAHTLNYADPTPLSFTSLLVALLSESGPSFEWLQNQLKPLSAQRVAERRWPGSTLPTHTPTLVSEAAASQSARRVLEEAEGIAKALGGGPLHSRHLVAAFPILPDWHVDDFADLDIDRLAWCREFGAYMAKSSSEEKWYWRQYADRASPVPLTSFSADVYTDNDLLGIDRSVEALALVMASSRTHTPLSIGVFGPWGSGKSFFMRHLRRRVWNLAELERKKIETWETKRKDRTAKAGDVPLYFGNVAQVEFNAWHYNESDLVASLVDHLFRNLRVVPDGNDDELANRQKAVLLQISGAKRAIDAVEGAIDEERARLEQARQQMQAAEEGAASARQGVDVKSKEFEESAALADRARLSVSSQIRELERGAQTLDPQAFVDVALRPLVDAPVLAQIRKTTEDLAREISGWRAFVMSLWSLRGMVVLVLVLLVPVVAWFTEWLQRGWAAFAGAGVTSAATMTVMVKFLRERRAEWEAKLKELEAAEEAHQAERREELESEAAQIKASWEAKLTEMGQKIATEREKLADRETRVSEAAAALALRTNELGQKMRERLEAQNRLQEAEARAKSLSSTLLLDEFIKERSATDDYRKQLGLRALVRRDFERLSDLITQANKDWCDPKKDTPAPLLNRIILYIDDLDRCKVETVISVLEAVHLLLAFPLFVCVVAVDPRWIERCLREKHSKVFSGQLIPDAGENAEGARVSVGDYLEKIFQIPIWMKSMDRRQRAGLVKLLLGSTAAPETPGDAPARDRAPDAAMHTNGTSHHQAEPRRSNGFSDAVTKLRERSDPLLITPDEGAYVDAVADLLSDKPRALKRFVNIYRLLKASLPDIDRDGFVTAEPASPHKICISQLALFTGHPGVAPLFVKELENAAPGSLTLGAWLEALPAQTRQQLEAPLRLIPEHEKIPLDRLAAWLPDTARYLFHRVD
jgi:hypothetical protein